MKALLQPHRLRLNVEASEVVWPPSQFPMNSFLSERRFLKQSFGSVRTSNTNEEKLDNLKRNLIFMTLTDRHFLNKTFVYFPLIIA